jgi:hypothetical protein
LLTDIIHLRVGCLPQPGATWKEEVDEPLPYVRVRGSQLLDDVQDLELSHLLVVLTEPPIVIGVGRDTV